MNHASRLIAALLLTTTFGAAQADSCAPNPAAASAPSVATPGWSKSLCLSATTQASPAPRCVAAGEDERPTGCGSPDMMTMMGGMAQNGLRVAFTMMGALLGPTSR